MVDKRVYSRFMVSVGGGKALIKLLEFDVTDFDVILGVWLVVFVLCILRLSDP